jgi:hypothetical protein
LKRVGPGLSLRIVGESYEHPDPPHLLGLLRTRGERPRGRRVDTKPSPGGVFLRLQT